MAYLEFGATPDNRYIHISQVTSGRHDELSCPYCGVSLIARKGRKLAHHFAHHGETCRDVGEMPEDAFSVPYYDKFDLGLTHNDMLTLKWLAGLDTMPDTASQSRLETLQDEGFITWNRWIGRSGDWELTDLGKIPLGQATLTKFADIQSEHIRQKHDALVKTVQQAYEPMQSWIDAQPDYVPKALATLNIYRTQLQRVFSQTLYFFEIKHDEGKLYKIGVTSRDIQERLREVERDVVPFLHNPKGKILRLCHHQGSVERYVKHRYQAHQVEIGNLTEYFDFDNRRNILSDLTRLGDADFFNGATWSQRILDGEPSSIERSIMQKEAQMHHRQATIAGMQKAREQGVHVGRPAESEQSFVDKYPEVVAMILQGASLRATAKKCGVSRNTVIKVKRSLSDD